jgi:hypothetical protein
MSSLPARTHLGTTTSEVESRPSPSLSPLAARHVPVLVLLILFGFELGAILILNGGNFIYTLDDAYIHLALAENIVRGHYGVNLGEWSAPASSIIWPVLLAPLSRFPIGAYVPLVINLLASVGTVYLFSEFTGRALRSSAAPDRFVIAGVLVILLIAATNLVGLLFTGMEHSLQVFLSVVLLLGIVREQDTRRVPWYLPVAIVCGPLVRYENLALAVPALLYLAMRQHYRALLVCAGALTVTMVGFSLFLYSKNLGLLPSSVLLKSGVMSQGMGLAAIERNLMENAWSRQGALLNVGLALLLAIGVNGRREPEDRVLAGWAVVALLLHLLVGTYGAYSRYEIYIWTTVLLTLLSLFGRQIAHWSEGVPVVRIAAVASVGALAVGLPYAATLKTTPLASRGIYEQQYQMHRFIMEYWHAPVAVNDLGWTSYRNDAYVLDLGGLASREAREAARDSANQNWMDVLARRHDVKLAMIYRDWFGVLPSRWLPVGELRLGTVQITPAGNTVTFYAMDAEALGRARAVARDYQKTLPSGARFVLYDQH